MKASYKSFNHEDSNKRIKEILDSSDINYEEVDSIPKRDRLTFTNGFYVNCGAMFVDIRGSSELPNKHKRPRLARIYRSYLSELVAAFGDGEKVCEINIEGDCVWGIYDCPYKPDINDLFSTAAKVSSTIDILNWRLSKKGIDELATGIGLSYGRALMIKAGYSGSGLNEVVWMGDVVNEASKLCSRGNKGWQNKEMMVSDVFRSNLNEHNQELLEWNSAESCYHGNVISAAMNDWLKDQKSK
jgi:class 3 adenylate cyclase